MLSNEIKTGTYENSTDICQVNNKQKKALSTQAQNLHNKTITNVQYPVISIMNQQLYGNALHYFVIKNVFHLQTFKYKNRYTEKKKIKVFF